MMLKTKILADGESIKSNHAPHRISNAAPKETSFELSQGFSTVKLIAHQIYFPIVLSILISALCPQTFTENFLLLI